MAGRKKAKTKKKEPVVKTRPIPAVTPSPPDEAGAPVDYGGLPGRDLKKNLGCG